MSFILANQAALWHEQGHLPRDNQKHGSSSDCRATVIRFSPPNGLDCYQAVFGKYSKPFDHLVAKPSYERERGVPECWIFEEIVTIAGALARLAFATDEATKMPRASNSLVRGPKPRARSVIRRAGRGSGQVPTVAGSAADLGRLNGFSDSPRMRCRSWRRSWQAQGRYPGNRARCRCVSRR